jgi:ribosome-binding protein aMBF1 (putative translation factor)
MEYQDWKSVVLKEKTPIIPKNIVAKPLASKISSSVKLNENDEIASIKYICKRDSLTITNARNLKKLTRKDLANKVNVKEDVIKDIETGKLIHDGNLIARIKKYLGVSS